MNHIATLINVFNFLFRGFILMKIWNWFPHEHLNAPELSYIPSLGLLTLFTVVTPVTVNRLHKNKTDMKLYNNNNIVSDTLTITLAYLFLFLISWIIHLFS